MQPTENTEPTYSCAECGAGVTPILTPSSKLPVGYARSCTHHEAGIRANMTAHATGTAAVAG